MALIVQKFGGTSVANIERIRNVAERVKREIAAGNQVVVVLSAMSGVTNQLVDYCGQVSPLLTPEALAGSLRHVPFLDYDDENGAL